jgi:hypothetical protein
LYVALEAQLAQLWHDGLDDEVTLLHTPAPLVTARSERVEGSMRYSKCAHY